jgi:phenylacetate-CoA ligase
MPENITKFLLQVYETSTGWRNRFSNSGVHPKDIKNSEELIKLPVLKKTDLPDLQNTAMPFGKLTKDNHKVARIFMSPGPIYDPQTAENDHWRFGEALEAAGITADDIVQNTFSYHLSPAGFMFDNALRNIGATVIPAGTGNTELQIQAMKDCNVTAYVGTPSYLWTILQAAQEKALTVGGELKLEKAFFTAEFLPDSLREKFEAMGITVSQGYGTADAGCIAYETNEEKGLKLAEKTIVQICNPSTGEVITDTTPGEVVVTVLDENYPLIRFGTGDLSAWEEGKTNERLKGVLGRVSDGIKVKGMFVHQKQLEEVFSREKGNLYYQAVVSEVDHRDHFTIFVEADEEIAGLAERLRAVIRINAGIKYVAKNSLSRSEKQFQDKREYFATTN